MISGRKMSNEHGSVKDDKRKAIDLDVLNRTLNAMHNTFREELPTTKDLWQPHSNIFNTLDD